MKRQQGIVIRSRFETICLEYYSIDDARPLDEIITLLWVKAALQHSGTVAVTSSSKDLKEAFKERFPGTTLNINVRSSSYLGSDNLLVDDIMLQTTQDSTRWRDNGVLLNYKPEEFDKISRAFKEMGGVWVSSTVNVWSILYSAGQIERYWPASRRSWTSSNLSSEAGLL